MFRKENNELPSTSSENNNEAANNNGNLLNLLHVKDTQVSIIFILKFVLKATFTSIKFCSSAVIILNTTNVIY